MNAKLFQIRLLKRAFQTRKKGVLDRDPRRKPDSRTCERKALSERDSCVCILGMRTEAMHGSISADCAVAGNKILPRSAQIVIVIGKAFAMHVNARSWNHDPNHEAECDPKRLSERDSFCEHRHYTAMRYLQCAIQITQRDVILRTHGPKYRHSNDHSNCVIRNKGEI